MIVDLLENKMTNKGISNIIATLFMLAIVVTFGTVILFQGINGINNFNTSLAPFLGDRLNLNSESLKIEHVYLNKDSGSVTIYVRNTGTIAVNISTIRMVQISSQSLLIDDSSTNTSIQIGTLVTITENANLSGKSWSDSAYSTGSYTLSLVTVRGNMYKAVVTPFNT